MNPRTIPRFAEDAQAERQLGEAHQTSSTSTRLANPKINVKPSRRKHVDQRVDAEQVNLPAHQIGDSRLGDTELICRRALGHAGPR